MSQLEGKLKNEIKLEQEYARTTMKMHRDTDFEGVKWAPRRIIRFRITCCGESHRVFDTFISLTIIVNVICIGIMSNLSLYNMNHPGEDGYDLSSFHALECLFLVIYYIEIFLRCVAGGWTAFCTKTMCFDIFLVVAGTLGNVIHHGMGLNDALFMLQVLILLRALRLYKVIKTLQCFAGLWRLVSSLGSAASTMTSTVILLMLALYIAGCFAIELISKDPLLREEDETRHIIDTFFPSLDIAMVTCLGFVTMDGLDEIYLPIVKRRGYIILYFATVMVVVSIALMNLVTANLVEVLLENAKRNTEAERKRIVKLRPSIQKAFCILDVSEDNLLSKEDIMMCNEALPPDFLRIVSRDKLLELVDMLDLDNSGNVTEREFSEAIEKIASNSLSFQNMQQLKLLTKIRLEQVAGFAEVAGVCRKLKRGDKNCTKFLDVPRNLNEVICC